MDYIQPREQLLFLKNNLSKFEPIIVHHGSLDRLHREESEEVLRRAKTGICIATTTLEIGIDIGDIDAVCMLSPPYSVSSFIQRLGRGSRRSARITGYGIYKSVIAKAIFEVFFELASCYQLEQHQRDFELAVAVQQIFSYLHLKRRVGASISAIERIFSSFGIKKENIQEFVGWLLKRRKLIRRQDGLFITGDRIQPMLNRGIIHSNIADPMERDFEVIDGKTGLVIGHIQKLTRFFILDGKPWEMLELKRNRVYVKKAAIFSLENSL